MVSCQPSVRYSNNIQEEEYYAETEENSNISTKTKTINYSIYYDKPAKIIYPKARLNKYSNRIINIAERWLGVPYLYGGNTKSGVDCSGFVKNVYNDVGVNLPRTSEQQFQFVIPTKNPEVGDLVFFKKNNKINHVGIYLGENNIIHSAISKGVIVQSIKDNPLSKMHAGYGKAI